MIIIKDYNVFIELKRNLFENIKKEYFISDLLNFNSNYLIYKNKIGLNFSAFSDFEKENLDYKKIKIVTLGIKNSFDEIEFLLQKKIIVLFFISNIEGLREVLNFLLIKHNNEETKILKYLWFEIEVKEFDEVLLYKKVVKIKKEIHNFLKIETVDSIKIVFRFSDLIINKKKIIQINWNFLKINIIHLTMDQKK